MNESVLLAIKKNYEKLGGQCDILNDIEHDYITENTCRNGRDVIWYADESNNIVIYIDTLDFLDDEEMEKELY